MKNLVCGRGKKGFCNPWGFSISPQVQALKHLTSVQATVVNTSEYYYQMSLVLLNKLLTTETSQVRIVKYS